MYLFNSCAAIGIPRLLVGVIITHCHKSQMAYVAALRVQTLDRVRFRKKNLVHMDDTATCGTYAAKVPVGRDETGDLFCSQKQHQIGFDTIERTFT